MSETEERGDGQAPADEGGRDKAVILAYEKLARRTKALYHEAKEHPPEWLEKAVDAAREQLEAAGEVTREQGQHAAQALKRDLEQTGRDFEEFGEKTREFLARDLEKTRADIEALGEKARDSLFLAQVGAGFLELSSTVLKGASNLFAELARASDDALAYHTGQVTRPGRLVCDSCGAEMNFKHVGRIPPCPKCAKTAFHRRL